MSRPTKKSVCRLLIVITSERPHRHYQKFQKKQAKANISVGCAPLRSSEECSESQSKQSPPSGLSCFGQVCVFKALNQKWMAFNFFCQIPISFPILLTSSSKLYTLHPAGPQSLWLLRTHSSLSLDWYKVIKLLKISAEWGGPAWINHLGFL